MWSRQRTLISDIFSHLSHANWAMCFNMFTPGMVWWMCIQQCSPWPPLIPIARCNLHLNTYGLHTFRRRIRLAIHPPLPNRTILFGISTPLFLYVDACHKVAEISFEKQPMPTCHFSIQFRVNLWERILTRFCLLNGWGKFNSFWCPASHNLKVLSSEN